MGDKKQIAEWEVRHIEGPRFQPNPSEGEVRERAPVLTEVVKNIGKMAKNKGEE